MRESLFRGKTDDGRWVEGCLICAPNYTCILEAEEKVHPMDYPYLDGELGFFDGKATPIAPETVGQFTGLTDKNGKKIFEGDIMRYAYSQQPVNCVVTFGKFNCDCGECMCGWHLYDGENRFFNDNLFGFEVIGNIHDNPELLGGDDQ